VKAFSLDNKLTGYRFACTLKGSYILTYRHVYTYMLAYINSLITMKICSARES
jgi:hypothetical protein